MKFIKKLNEYHLIAKDSAPFSWLIILLFFFKLTKCSFRILASIITVLPTPVSL